MTAVLRARGVRLTYGGVRAIDDLDLDIEPGAIHAIIGPNGAGKTSLLNVCSGITTPNAGTVEVVGTDVSGARPSAVSRAGLARTFQNIQLFPHTSAMDNVLVGATAQARIGMLAATLGTARARRLETEAREVATQELAFVGLEHRANDQAGSLPYGNQRLLEIARALATGPRVLLLDEPGAGFNSDEKQHLATLLTAIRDRGIVVVLVEHDMPLVMSVADRITVVNFGSRIAEGDPRSIAADPVVIEAYLGVDDEEG